MWYMPAADLVGLAAGDVGDRGLAEDVARASTPSLPDPAGLLALLADLAVESLDDLEHGDLLGRAGER